VARAVVLRAGVFFAAAEPRFGAAARLGAALRAAGFAVPRVAVFFAAGLRVAAPRVLVPRAVFAGDRRVVDRTAMACARGLEVGVTVSSLIGGNSS
jgi:hypothetical protein